MASARSKIFAEAMFQSTAILKYSPSFRLVAEVDQGIADYYRAMIPRSMSAQKSRWPAHITVVRAEKETPTYPEHWDKYEDEVVLFNYDPIVRIDRTYYWLNVWCDRLAQIREELGLPPKSRWTRPPSGEHQCFHLTIANKKNVSR